MRIKSVPMSEIRNGLRLDAKFYCGGYPQISASPYRAKWVEGRGIVVTDAEGDEVKVTYGSTHDMRSCHAHATRVGFIGGWQYPHRAMPFKYLIDCINNGKIYAATANLPKKYVAKRGQL
jgi:hypothetical protein